MTLRTLEVDDQAAIDGAGADLVAAWLAERPDALMVPALGHSALGVYAGLGRRVRDGALDASRVTLAQLDAYGGIAADDARSLYGWLLRDVAAPLALPPAQVLRLPGDARDPHAAAREHADAIARHGGIDVAVLGLGPNGHLGYNEPPSPADAPTRVVRLAPASLASAVAYCGPLPVPEWALTIGMRELLAARHTLLVVSGERKREVLRRVLGESPTPDVPASLLREAGGSVTVLSDRAAWPAELPVPAAAG